MAVKSSVSDFDTGHSVNHVSDIAVAKGISFQTKSQHQLKISNNVLFILFVDYYPHFFIFIFLFQEN